MLCRTRGVKENGKKDKGGGSRSLEDHNTYDVVMNALKNDELNKENLGRLFSRQMKAINCAIRR